MIHDLKTWPVYFEPIIKDLKTFDFRREDDIRFEVGDLLRLKEYLPISKTYTGREIIVEVIYLTRLEALDTGLPGDFIIMSIRKLK